MGIENWTQDMHKVYLVAFGEPLAVEQIAEKLKISEDRVLKAIEGLEKENAIERLEAKEVEKNKFN